VKFEISSFLKILTNLILHI